VGGVGGWVSRRMDVWLDVLCRWRDGCVKECMYLCIYIYLYKWGGWMDGRCEYMDVNR
jgi:hypothetical protein